MWKYHVNFCFCDKVNKRFLLTYTVSCYQQSHFDKKIVWAMVDFSETGTLYDEMAKMDKEFIEDKSIEKVYQHFAFNWQIFTMQIPT